MTLTVIPLKARYQKSEFDLFNEITKTLSENGVLLENGDVIVISSKYIASSQGRILDIDKVTISENANHVSKKYKMDPKFVEIVLRESDKIFGGISGFIITSSDNILAPNAGIDKSNSNGTRLILYPENPYQIAEILKRKIFFDYSVHVGIIITDSRLMPARVGTVGVAIACSGLEPVKDLRGQHDLDGNPLKVTFQATADNLASIANHKMGEGSESQPIAIVRDSECELTSRKIEPTEMSISHEECVYVRGFSNRLN
ncbi:MAG: coenzyme F420-0:L-glutamate ligase [Candidatus Nitrosopelagicus sp.]|nr:coenzyme F420-0:L-glutamate ligase [Candidatus Nitrosopelagicus sp.]|tara:strand:- start:1264 stop:2037 length:774 start_codon:yes stop_codon:yes gene_type:complete